jgi:hypothetical protein
VSFACRRFRAGFRPGDDQPHRRTCPECDAYAAALERAAGLRLPLPGSLRRRLLDLHAPMAENPADGAEAAPRPLPQLPLPAGLRDRLLAVPARTGTSRPPQWVLSPRYAIAASYLAAVLLGATLGGPADLGRRFAHGVEQTLEVAGSAGRERLERLETAASAARRSAGRSVERLGERLPPLPAHLDHHENDAPRPGRGVERRFR